jgi:hypothetical protein
MSKKQASPRGFRPWPENEKRLEYAGKIGLSLNEFLNELVENYGRDFLKKKSETIQQTLEAPIP